MNFHKGRPRNHSFFFEGSKIVNGKAFTDVPNKKMGVVCNPFQLLFEQAGDAIGHQVAEF